MSVVKTLANETSTPLASIFGSGFLMWRVLPEALRLTRRCPLFPAYLKLINSQIDGHQDSNLGGRIYFHLLIDIPDQTSKILATEHQFFIFTS